MYRTAWYVSKGFFIVHGKLHRYKNSNWSGKTCYILSQLMVMEFPRLNDGEAVI